MNPQLVNIAHKIGMDKSIAYSSGARIVQGITGVASIFFIATFLTGVEQGFYFTFGSILALQVFFELGLTGIMTQYVAHEASHITIRENYQYEGEDLYISRLASLIRFCVKWYSVLAIGAFLFLLVVGFMFFYLYEDSNEIVSWQMPWVLVCLGTALKLFQAPFNSIYMGMGKVKEMSKIGFYQQIVIPAAIWIGLICGLKLYVMGIAYILSVIIWQIYVNQTKLDRIIVNLWKRRITKKINYVKEIFPYQWRIALSWVSGYFIFQLFNPVLFATEGAVVAGQMGMTLSALNAIQAFAMSWLNTKIPLYSQLIALKKYVELDTIFNKTLKQMAFVCFVLLVAFLFAILCLDLLNVTINGNVVVERFLPYIPMVILMIPVFFQQFVSSWATYLRCHKKEPFLVISIVAGILCSTSTLLFGKLCGLYGIVIGYLCIQLFIFPWGYWIYKTKKTEWHYE